MVPPLAVFQCFLMGLRLLCVRIVRLFGFEPRLVHQVLDQVCSLVFETERSQVVRADDGSRPLDTKPSLVARRFAQVFVHLRGAVLRDSSECVILAMTPAGLAVINL